MASSLVYFLPLHCETQWANCPASAAWRHGTTLEEQGHRASSARSRKQNHKNSGAFKLLTLLLLLAGQLRCLTGDQLSLVDATQSSAAVVVVAQEPWLLLDQWHAEHLLLLLRRCRHTTTTADVAVVVDVTGGLHTRHRRARSRPLHHHGSLPRIVVPGHSKHILKKLVHHWGLLRLEMQTPLLLLLLLLLRRNARRRRLTT